MINRTMARLGALIAAAGSLTAGAALLAAGTATASGSVPRLSHVVIVVMENKNYGDIIGRPDEAPYLNGLAKGGASFSQSFAVGHPSEPNYLALFSGSTHGLTDDSCPHNYKNAANLGAELIGKGLSFAGYAESMKRNGYTGGCGEVSLGYTRVHNPWVDFSNVPASSNLTFAKFPKDFTRLPTVSFVIPNLCHDMHYCSRDSGDAWIKNNLGGYAKWARSHNSLLIVTFDEDGEILGLGGDGNKIPTIFYGAHVKAGTYGQHITHYGVLRTIEDMYGLGHAGTTGRAIPIINIWK